MDEQHAGGGAANHLDQLDLSIPEELPSPLYALEDISDADLTYPGMYTFCFVLELGVRLCLSAEAGKISVLDR